MAPTPVATLAYLDDMQLLVERAVAQAERILAASEASDNGQVGFADVLEELSDASAGLKVVALDADELNPPDELASLHEQMKAVLDDTGVLAADAVSGLQSTDDGTARREATAGLLDTARLATLTLDAVFREVGEPIPRIPVTLPTTTTSTTTTTTTTAPACHPSYVGACVPIGVSDVDCRGGSGDGPYYVGRVTVVGPDVYGLDRDNDGIGCESSWAAPFRGTMTLELPGGC